MITQAQIANVLDHPVYDVDGSKIGDTRHLFLDDATGEPEWVSVRTGLFGTGESFVPLREATLVEDHLEVPYSKSTVKDAPHVDVDAGGFLTVDEEHRLYEHYDIAWDEDPGWQQVVDRPERVGQSHRRSRTVADTGDGASLPYDNTTASGIARGGQETPDVNAPQPGYDNTTASGIARGSHESPHANPARSGNSEDDAMTHPHEHERAGVESPATGRPRLRLYTTSEVRR
ncbi:PRC-barrel domain-containing protein [Streptomyces sp. NPDC021080]|uniref:PRC-barrel domain-containing protein n=1 Tax=Streptomyces sp. NPDC021080 TaxID=3365110 RepID=UPI003793268F